MTDVMLDDAPMKLSDAVHQWISEDTANGRINSKRTVDDYLYTLNCLRETVDNRDPRKIGKDDVQRCLARWADCKPSTRAKRHAALRSFFEWCVFNDLRTSNPARAVRPTKVPKPEVKRITRGEAVLLLAHDYPSRRMGWAVRIGLLAGLRCEEMTTLTKRDLMRVGHIRVDGKGNKVRWVPVLDELAPVIDEILDTLSSPDHYVFCSRERRGGAHRGAWVDNPAKGCATKTIFNYVREAGELVGLAVEISPHVLRRSFIEVVLSQAGQAVAQAAAGHESFDTTAHYAGGVDVLAEQARVVRYVPLSPRKEAVLAHVH